LPWLEFPRLEFPWLEAWPWLFPEFCDFVLCGFVFFCLFLDFEVVVCWVVVWPVEV
jgi:hypothetical protein